jgi:oligopeptidase B
MRRPFNLITISLMLVLLTSFSNNHSSELKPPVAKKIPKTDTIHGDVRIDDYFWLRQKDSPEVQSYLHAENAYTDSLMAHTKSDEEKLYKELVSRVKETDTSVPTKMGDYFYYSRTEKDKQYGIYCRKHLSLVSPEEITLDLNQLGEGKPYIDLGEYSTSDNGELLAYSLDYTGFREYELFFKNLKTGMELSDRVGKVASLCWAADNKTFFYTVEDTTKRSYRLYRRALGDSDGTLIYEEKDALYGVYAGRTRDKKYNLLIIGSKTTSEIHYVRSDTPTEKFMIVLARETDHEYSLDHRNGEFFIRTNKNAKNFRLVSTPVSAPDEKNWKELVAHRLTIALNDFDVFENYCVLTVRDNGLQELEVMDLNSNQAHRMRFPEPTYSVYGALNPDFNTTHFRYSYQSLISPSAIYDYDLSTKQSTLLKEYEVPAYDKSLYASERIFATASDGTQIPISIVYKKTTPRNGSAPIHLYSYGSYGISMWVTFTASRLSLLDRGFVCALAHIRGGADMGEAWHDEGKMMKKKTTFTDFISCAEYLTEKKYGAKDKLIIEGGSAGGLLMGAAANLRPDLFKIVHLAVPFVDVINTMLDESLPLTTGEFIEWGNPKIKSDYEYMKSYCPYSNIEAKAYPTMLITTSINDSQVMYWEPAKYAAKMRAMRTDKNLLLLKINMDAGHGGASGRYDALKERAFELAFFFDQLGIKT